MKKIRFPVLILFILLCALLSSCKKEDQTTNENPTEVTLTSIELDEGGTINDVYNVGELLDLSDANILATYSNEKTKIIKVTADMVSGFLTAEQGNFKLTITYEGKTCEWNYEVKLPRYTVAFVDLNGRIISNQRNVVQNTSAIEPPVSLIPVIDGYDFVGWDKSFDKVTSNLTVKTVYAIKKFNVTFKDYDGSILREFDNVAYGSTVFVPQSPSRVGYTFINWSGEDLESKIIVKNSVTYTANYSINSYTVKFYDYYGEVCSNQSINYNSSATAPTLPDIAGKTFNGWNKAFDKITANIQIYPNYSDTTYQVTYTDLEGNVLRTFSNLSYNYSMIIISDTMLDKDLPIPTGKVFYGWEFNATTFVAGNSVNVKNDIVLTPVYSDKDYAITFVYLDKDTNSEVEFKKCLLHYGDTIPNPMNELPTRYGYTIAGWDKDIPTSVTKSEKFTAVYEPVLVEVVCSGGASFANGETDYMATFDNNITMTAFESTQIGNYILSWYFRTYDEEADTWSEFNPMANSSKQSHISYKIETTDKIEFKVEYSNLYSISIIDINSSGNSLYQDQIAYGSVIDENIISRIETDLKVRFSSILVREDNSSIDNTLIYPYTITKNVIFKVVLSD